MSTNKHLPTAAVPRRLKLRSRGGCIECKLRKRKCDEVKPECGPCGRLRHKCEWLDQYPLVEQRAILESHKQKGKKTELELRTGAQVPLRNLTAEHANIRISFLLHRAFSGANTATGSGDCQALTVRSELQFATPGSLSWTCMDAMAMVHWGKYHNDPAMVAAGYKAKGVNLTQLQHALSHNITSGDVLATVALARLFESMLPNARFQWVIHAQGLTHLVQAMGPQAFAQPAMRRLLEHNRYVMIISSSYMRKPTIFNSIEWKTIPWKGVPKDMVQSMLDTYARMPTIHAAWDTYQQASGDNRSRAERRCIKLIREMLLELHEWRLSVDTEIAASVKAWEPVNTIASCPWRQPVSFARFYHIIGLGLFNSSIIVLSKYIHSLPEAAEGLVEGPVNHNAPDTLLVSPLLPLGSPLKRAAQAADEIASIAPWAMQNHTKGAGSQYMGVPAMVALGFWRIVDPEKAKLFAPTLVAIDRTWASLLTVDALEDDDSDKENRSEMSLMRGKGTSAVVPS